MKFYPNYFDPCPSNPTFDGLAIQWHEFNFVNPPYDDKVEWILKAIEQQKKDRTSVLLLPVDTSTNWFHDLIVKFASVSFIKNRLYFNGKRAPFASMLCTFEPL